MTEIKLNSTTIDGLNTYLDNLEQGLNDALLNISFNENEINRLTGVIEQAKARYLMDRSEASKTALETAEKALEQAQKDLKLDYLFLSNREKRYGTLELTEQEFESVVSDINDFMEPIQDKKAVINRKLDELAELVEEYSSEYELYAEQIGSAISSISKACKKGTNNKVIIQTNVGGLNISSKLRDIHGSANEGRFFY